MGSTVELQTIEWIFEHIEELFLIPITVFCFFTGIRIVKSRGTHLSFVQNLLVKYQRGNGDEAKAEEEKKRLIQWNRKTGYGYIHIYGSIFVLVMIVFSLFSK